MQAAGLTDASARVQQDLTFVAAIPDSYGRMRAQAANLVAELGVLRCADSRTVTLLSVLHVVINQDSKLVAGVVKGIR